MKRIKDKLYTLFVAAVIFGVPALAGWGLLILCDRLLKLWGC